MNDRKHVFLTTDSKSEIERLAKHLRIKCNINAEVIDIYEGEIFTIEVPASLAFVALKEGGKYILSGNVKNTFWLNYDNVTKDISWFTVATCDVIEKLYCLEDRTSRFLKDNEIPIALQGDLALLSDKLEKEVKIFYHGDKFEFVVNCEIEEFPKMQTKAYEQLSKTFNTYSNVYKNNIWGDFENSPYRMQDEQQ